MSFIKGVLLAENKYYFLVDWSRQVQLATSSPPGEVAWLPLQWLTSEEIVFNDVADKQFFIQRAQQQKTFYASRKVLEQTPRHSADTVGFSEEDDKEYWELYRGAQLIEYSNEPRGEAYRRNVTSGAYPWWMKEAWEDCAEDQEEGSDAMDEVDEAGTRSNPRNRVRYNKRSAGDSGWIVNEEDHWLTPRKSAGVIENEEDAAVTPTSRHQGLLERLAASAEQRREFERSLSVPLERWIEKLAQPLARGGLSDKWTAAVENNIAGARCNSCSAFVKCGSSITWNAKDLLWDGTVLTNNLSRHSANRHSAPRQLERAIIETGVEAPVNSHNADAQWRQFLAQHVGLESEAVVSCADVPEAVVPHLFRLLLEDAVLYLADESTCHQPKRYQSERGIKRFESVLAKGFGAYWTSAWFRAHSFFVISCTRSPKREAATAPCAVRLLLNITDTRSRSGLYNLLRECLDMETVVRGQDHWNGRDVSLERPAKPEEREVVFKKLGGTAVASGQLLEASSAIDKGLHHVEFLTYALVRAAQHLPLAGDNPHGLPSQILEMVVREMQTMAKRHQNGLRKQTKSLRHQSFLLHAEKVLLMHATMHENHARHIELFGSLLCDMTEFSLCGAISELTELRKTLYESPSFVQCMLEAFFITCVLEHGVQRTQVYRELIFLQYAADLGLMPQLAGRVVSGILEEPDACFSMIILADKIQNAGPLKLIFSKQGAVIVSILADYSDYLLESGKPIRAKRETRTQKIQDALEELDEKEAANDFNDENDDEEEEDDADIFDNELEVDDEMMEEEEEGCEGDGDFIHADGTPNGGVNGGSSSFGKLDSNILRPVFVSVSTQGKYQAVRNHKQLFDLFAGGVQKLVPTSMPLDKDADGLEVYFCERGTLDVIPLPLKNARVNRSWNEEYLALVTHRLDPTFVEQTAMLRRHSYNTIQRDYVPDLAEAEFQRQTMRLAMLIGKAEGDFVLTQLDVAVEAHLATIKKGVPSVRPDVWHAIRFMSNGRRVKRHIESGCTTDSLLKRPSLAELINYHNRVLLAICDESFPAKCIRVPIPAKVGSLPVLEISGCHAVPECHSCHLPLDVIAIQDHVTAEHDVLNLEQRKIQMPDAETAELVALAARRGRVTHVLGCVARGFRQDCSSHIALLTTNFVEVSYRYTREEFDRIFCFSK